MFLPAPMLGLSWPEVPFAKSQGKTLLIWGGASAVGSGALIESRGAVLFILLHVNFAVFQFSSVFTAP